MYRKLRKVVILAMMCITLLCSIEVVKADVTIDNTGEEMKSGYYGDSKLASSFSNAKYVDCYVPYKLTPEDIGGYAVGAYAASTQNSEAKGAPMPESTRGKPVATVVTYEGYYDYLTNKWPALKAGNSAGFTVETEESTQMDIVTDKNGNKYYMCAVQPWFFRHEKKGADNFPDVDTVSPDPKGYLFDVILTDGTCIHFVCMDINAAQHTNGIDETGESKFDTVYTNSELKMKQYNNLFSSQNGNTFELWGHNPCDGFMQKYNFGSGEDKTKIAYYRMYNIKLSDSPQRNQGVGKEVSFSYGNVTIKEGSNGVDISNGLKAEKDLTDMPSLDLISDDQNTVNLPDSSSLTAKENATVDYIRTNIKNEREDKFYTFAVTSVVFVGLMLILYAVLLLLAYIFDRANILFNISLLGIISLGHLSYPSDATMEKGFLKRILKICFILIMVGSLLVTLHVLNIISMIVFKVMDMLGIVMK